jgi:hypothetical protein
MLESPFWDEMIALKLAKERTSGLLMFATARELVLPANAEQRLEQLEPVALKRLVDLALTEPEAAAAALLAATQPRNS